MKSNTDKCHLLVLNQKDNTIRIGTEEVTGCTSVKLLGVTVDNKLNFEEHVTKLGKKANQELHALARISKYLCTDKLRILMKTYVEFQFNYCPLVWMFHSRTLNNRINKLHERALRIVYENPNLTLLTLDNSFPYITETYKSLQRKCLK